MKEYRPRVSEINFERLGKYPGDSFDDRLGQLLLLKELAGSSNKSLVKLYGEQYKQKWQAVFALVLMTVLAAFGWWL